MRGIWWLGDAELGVVGPSWRTGVRVSGEAALLRCRRRLRLAPGVARWGPRGSMGTEAVRSAFSGDPSAAACGFAHLVSRSRQDRTLSSHKVRTLPVTRRRSRTHANTSTVGHRLEHPLVKSVRALGGSDGINEPKCCA